MKRTLLIVAACSILFSCGNNGKTEAQLQHESDSLKLESTEAQRDSLLSLVGEISESLTEVSRMENVITSPDFQSETPQQKRQILANIQALRDELRNRQDKLVQLEARLKKSNNFSKELERTIEAQKTLIAEQSAKIDQLQQQLIQANAEIANLNVRVDSLHTEVATVTEQKVAAEQHSQAVTNELNTCFYAMGSKSELKAHNLLEKKFLGKTKIMEGNFDRSFFTKADKRTLKSINTYAPKAKILTKQPVSSYEINDVGGNKVINITNPTLFWEKSDFLIIQIN